MTWQSCIYEGEVRHRRFAPVSHAFRYRMFLLYLDLDELPTLFNKRWLWSTTHANLAWFRREDHLGDREQSLAAAVRDLVEARTGKRPTGPIRLLTHLRYFGFAMNPISLYYCFDADGGVEFVVAEVTNTPWGEQYCYVLSVLADRGHTILAGAAKKLHVSPFLGMDFDYVFRLTPPGESLAVHIENHARGDCATRAAFDATLAMRRVEWSGWALASALTRYPFMTARVGAGIYWQAFRLWLKRVPFVPHPPADESSGNDFTRDANRLCDGELVGATSGGGSREASR